MLLCLSLLLLFCRVVGSVGHVADVTVEVAVVVVIAVIVDVADVVVVNAAADDDACCCFC